MLRFVRLPLLTAERQRGLSLAVRAMSGEIKDEGGKLAKKAAADESQYIRQIEREQWKALKKHHTEEIEEHKRDIKRLQQRIKEHEDRLEKITHDHD